MARKKARGRMFVNVYEVDRCYGGPQEGGWYYDCGEVADSYELVGGRNRKRMAERKRRQLQSEFCPRGGRSQRSYMRCKYRVVVERQPGQPFPKQRPRYE